MSPSGALMLSRLDSCFQQVKDKRTFKAVWLAALPDAEAAAARRTGDWVFPLW